MSRASEDRCSGDTWTSCQGSQGKSSSRNTWFSRRESTPKGHALTCKPGELSDLESAYKAFCFEEEKETAITSLHDDLIVQSMGALSPTPRPGLLGRHHGRPSVLAGVVPAAPNPDAQVPPVKWPQTVAQSVLSPGPGREQVVLFPPGLVVSADGTPGAGPTAGASTAKDPRVCGLPQVEGQLGSQLGNTLKPSAQVTRSRPRSTRFRADGP